MVEDPIFKDNGSRIKNLCRSSNLCMTQTFFEHPLEKRFTRYSGGQKTKKVIDYVLVEPFVQQYIMNCEVLSDFNFETDNRLSIVSIETPKTRKARRGPKKVQKSGNLYLNSLKDIDTEQLFARTVTSKIND